MRLFPEIISADELRLRQVLGNLLSNAIKFTESGSIIVRASKTPPTGLSRLEMLPVHPSAAPCVNDCDFRIYFSVTDTGIGIDEEDKEKLFKSFSQLDCTIGRKYSGTGIGLVISKRLVNLMGGEIVFESTKGFGSTFAFSIYSRAESCCVENLNTESDKPELTKSLVSNNLDRPCVLVVDDNEINRIVAEGLVSKLGYDVESVDSGETAVNKICEKYFDLVLLDIHMPGINGYETAVHIRKQLNTVKQPVIIAMTADVLNEVEEKCQLNGLDGVLIKPVTEESLLDLFNNYKVESSKGVVSRVFHSTRSLH